MTVSLKGPTGPGGSGKVVAGLGAVVGVGPDCTVVRSEPRPIRGHRRSPTTRPERWQQPRHRTRPCSWERHPRRWSPLTPGFRTATPPTRSGRRPGSGARRHRRARCSSRLGLSPAGSYRLLHETERQRGQGHRHDHHHQIQTYPRQPEVRRDVDLHRPRPQVDPVGPPSQPAQDRVPQTGADLAFTGRHTGHHHGGQHRNRLETDPVEP